MVENKPKNLYILPSASHNLYFLTLTTQRFFIDWGFSYLNRIIRNFIGVFPNFPLHFSPINYS